MEKGAASPGRWQVWQCFCKIGATSLVNVGGGLFGSCARTPPAEPSANTTRIVRLVTERRATSIFLTFDNRNVEVDRKILEVLSFSTQQQPSYLKTIDSLALSQTHDDARVSIGKVTASADGPKEDGSLVFGPIARRTGHR